MTIKSKSPSPKGASTSDSQNQGLSYVNTGIVRPQTRIVAVGKLRRELVADMFTLPALSDAKEHFNLRRDENDFVADYGFARRDGSEAINLRVTFKDWQPRLSVLAMDLYEQLLDSACLADFALHRAQGRTWNSRADREAILTDLVDLNQGLSAIEDEIEAPRNWLPAPDDVVVTIEWWHVKPEVAA